MIPLEKISTTILSKFIIQNIRQSYSYISTNLITFFYYLTSWTRYFNLKIKNIIIYYINHLIKIL